MTTRNSSRFRELLHLCASECKEKWEQWSIDLHAFWQYFFMPQRLAWGSLEEMAFASPERGTFTETHAFSSTASSQQQPVTRKWMVAETIDANDNNNTMLVEVEFFPSEGITSRANTATYYTAEGEDPNLRITHYPPSNRLH